ncbi:hypothetical protein HDU76_002254 [Blyttiomyces sp. JEL0837]|nr:hypothetical protein HDU76_002254 [Blyttiomyces sp. JEL0837]
MVKQPKGELVGKNNNNRKRKHENEENEKEKKKKNVKQEDPEDGDGGDDAADEMAAFADQLDPAAKHKCVVAIDFGTVGCAYVWGFTRPGQNLDSRTNVFMNKPWPHTTGGKTTTAVLFHNGSVAAFGHAAVEKLANVKTKERNQYIFLHRFKMQLYSKEKINESARAEIKACGNTVLHEDILWVVTVPAIWREDAKRLMRMAAIDAGLTRADLNTSLLLVLEPEAASIFCLMEDKSEFKTGDVYIVADCGGGTVDVTVHEIASALETKVKEAIPVSGGHWGSTVIDKAFYNLLELMCGRETILNPQQKHASRWHQLCEEWERKKCAWDGTDSSEVLVMLPTVVAMEVEKGLDAFNDSADGEAIGEIELDGERLVPSNTVMNHLSKEAITKTVDHISTILDRVPKVSKILLVGNFANSIALQNAFQNEFEPRVKVLIPTVPGECVARGAVILGNRPRRIEERKAAFAYGYNISAPFVEGVHPPVQKYLQMGNTTALYEQTRVKLHIYEGQRDGIEYTDDKDLRKLGFVESVKCDPVLLAEEGVKICMLFGNSELCVSTKDGAGVVTSVNMVYK